MKRQLRNMIFTLNSISILILSFLTLFSSHYYGQAGSTCANPLVVTTIPYSQTSQTTSGFGDDYSTNSCNNSYLGGDDFVYEYTPSSNIDISVILSNTSTYVGVFVFDGCPSTGACVAFNTSSSGNPSIGTASLTSGTTYYIIISTWPSPQSTPFDIAISEVLPAYDMVAGAQTHADCGFNFRDNGGNSNYSNSFSGTTTLSPVNSSQKVVLDFTSFNTESGFDKVWIYDGPNDTYPVLVNGVSGSSIPTGNPFTSTASGGELTFKFASDGSVNKPGWSANITCTGPAVCIDPSNLTSSNITPNSADLSWTENGSASTWDIELGTSGFIPSGIATISGTNSNPYIYSNLTSSTTYDFYIRSDCGGMQSSWVGPFSFSTAACNLLPPSSQNSSNITNSSASLSWVENGNATVWNIELGASGFSPSGTPTSSNISTNPYTYSGLSSTTSYDYYVQAVCNGSSSSWTGPYSFTTTAIPSQYTSEMIDGWARAVIQCDDGNYIYAGGANSDHHIVKTTQSGIPIWAKTYGGTGWNEKAYGIVNSGDGGYIILGQTNSSNLNISGGSDTDIMITKLNNSGSHVWSRVVGTTSNDQANYDADLIKNPDGTYAIAANFGNDMGFIHLDASGSVLATKTLNTHSASAYSIIKASGTNGGWLIAGKIVVSSPSKEEFMIVKLKEDYTEDWSMVWGDGTTTKEEIYSMIENGPDDYTVFGLTAVDGTSPINMYAMRFTNSGSGYSVAWEKAYGGPASANFKDAKPASDGNYMVVGHHSAASGGAFADAYLMKINASNGSIIWQTEKPDDGNNRQAEAIFIESAGSFIVAGLGGFDMLKFAPDGTICNGINGTMVAENLDGLLTNFDATEASVYTTFGVSTTTKSLSTNDYGSFLIGCNIVPLPVDLVNFDGNKELNFNYLHWKTSAEINNDYFVLERSFDAQSWQDIALINGAGTTTEPQQYSYNDFGSFPEFTYYRLKQVDFNGHVSYHNIIVITNDFSLENPLIVFPNPASSLVNIIYSSDEINTPINLQIIDQFGQITIVKYLDAKSHRTSFSIDIDNLSSGIYYIIAQTPKEKFTKKLIVID